MANHLLARQARARFEPIRLEWQVVYRPIGALNAAPLSNRRDPARRRGSREMFVPLSHPPGHGQADFGEALVVIGGIEQKVHFFAFDLPHSDACYIRAYRPPAPEGIVPMDQRPTMH